MNIDQKYKNILKDILEAGEEVQTRNSKVVRKFGVSVTFDSTPLISVRRTAWKYSLLEWEWFMSGSNSINDLDSRVRKWWKPWTDNNGAIWNSYGSQIRYSRGSSRVDNLTGRLTQNSLDQVAYIVDGIKNHPNSRRNVMSSWNPADMAAPNTKITNCHLTALQFSVDKNNKLHAIHYQRSNDMMLGFPSNVFQYWAFMLWLCHWTGRDVGTFTHIIGDAHIYEDHIDMAKKLVDIDTSEVNTPSLSFTPTSDKFKANDFSLYGEYKPSIKENLEMII